MTKYARASDSRVPAKPQKIYYDCHLRDTDVRALIGFLKHADEHGGWARAGESFSIAADRFDIVIVKGSNDAIHISVKST